jgi:hypothetical protein
MSMGYRSMCNRGRRHRQTPARARHAAAVDHEPEKQVAVFRKDHPLTQGQSGMMMQRKTMTL